MKAKIIFGPTQLHYCVIIQTMTKIVQATSQNHIDPYRDIQMQVEGSDIFIEAMFTSYLY